MRFLRTLAIGIGIATVSTVVTVATTVAAAPIQSGLSEAGNKQQRGYGKEDINAFCVSDRVTEPEPGIHFDGVAASEEVLDMAFGRYDYANGGVLLFFPDGQYLLRLPNDGARDTIYGTDGSDWFGGGILGGCFVEQLSEVIAKNSLSADGFVLVTAYE